MDSTHLSPRPEPRTLGAATAGWLAILALPILISATPVEAQSPGPGLWRDAVRRLRGVAPAKRPASQPRLSGTGQRSLSAIVLESEPNDSVATADSLTLGDQASGVISPQRDTDIWFVDLTAGQILSVDVDANALGSPLDPVLALFGPDGRTVLAANDDFDGFDSRLTFRVVESGRYFLSIRGFGVQGGPEFRYEMNVGELTCGVTGGEREPNDSPATATPFAIGDTVSGEICPHDTSPAGDLDYWVFTAQAGTTLEVDVDAAALGTLSDPFLQVFASDGITRLAANDDADGADSRLQVSITTTGSYYAVVSTLDPESNPFPYRMQVRPIQPGPGDPIAIRADRLGIPFGLAAGRTGDLFIGDVAAGRVVRLSSQGAVTPFATGITSPTGLAFNGAGDLLVVSFADQVVYRVAPQGQVTRFITDAGIPFWVAVAPDGRIWLTDLADRSLRRYSPTGQFEARFDAIATGGAGPGPLAIGPSGEPYFSQGTEIWKLANGQFRRVVASRFTVWGFAFDLAGSIYAPAPAAGRVQLFDAAGAIVADTFAIGPDSPQVLAFGRDGNGATVARLFGTDSWVGSLIEMNPAGITRPGLPVGTHPPLLPPETATAAVLGGAGLSPGELELLDGIGNHNGRYDLGDFQAFLRSIGELPSATGAAAQSRPKKANR